jgi:hypothetical protein
MNMLDAKERLRKTQDLLTGQGSEKSELVGEVGGWL